MASNGDVNTRISGYWEKFSIWACGCVVALLCVGYQDQKTTIDRLEERVQFLYLDKVGKDELKDVEARIMNRIEAGNANILDKIDLLIRANANSK